MFLHADWRPYLPLLGDMGLFGPHARCGPGQILAQGWLERRNKNEQMRRNETATHASHMSRGLFRADVTDERLGNWRKACSSFSRTLNL
jgi:hypothetical protein